MYISTKCAKSCYICNKNISDNSYVICVRCKIRLHDNCQEIHNNNKNYCICPNPACQKVGSLGSIYQ